MRKLLDTKAGASFNQEMPDFTINVKKEYVELIFKMKPSIYVIVNLLRQSDNTALLFTNWGNFFNRISNEKRQMPLIAKNCKVLYGILIGEDSDEIMETQCGATEQKVDHGLGMKIPIRGLSLISSVDEQLIRTANEFVNKNLKVYNEILHNLPLPGWKEGLRDLWN